MPRAICEDCGSLVAAEVTHNGVCAVGHYVHCGWGHELHLDDLISDEAGEIVAGLEKGRDVASIWNEAVDEALDILDDEGWLGESRERIELLKKPLGGKGE